MTDVESGEMTTDRGRMLEPTAHFVRTHRRLDRCVDFGIIVAGIAAFAVAVTSTAWPRYHDAPLLEYMAWLIHRGYRPYRAIYDIDLPGAVLFHVVGQRVFGNSDLSLRVRDLLLLAAGLAVVFRVMRRFDTRVAWVAVVLIAGRYLAYGGAVQSLQRDWILALLAMAAVALVLHPGAWWRFFLAGAAVGFAATIKPPGFLLIVLVAVVAFVASDDSPDAPWRVRVRIRAAELIRSTAVAVAGAVVAIGVIATWLVNSGGWSAFRWSVGHFLPVYGRFDSGGHPYGSYLEASGHQLVATLLRPDLLLLVAGASLLLTLRRPRPASTALVALTGLMAYGVLHAVIETKDWDYHYWPFTVASLCVVAVSFSDLRASRSEPRPHRARAMRISARVYLGLWFLDIGLIGIEVARAVALRQHGQLLAAPQQAWAITLGLPLAVLSMRLLTSAGYRTTDSRMRERRGWIATGAMLAPLGFATILGITVAIDPAGTTAIGIRPAYDNAEVQRTDHLARLLRARSRPGDRVQVLDTTGGGIAAALKAGLEPGSRLMFDFPVYNDPSAAATTQMRADMIHDLAKFHPRFFLVYRQSWGPRNSYRSLNTFPALVEVLAHYRVVYQDSEVRLMERRSLTT